MASCQHLDVAPVDAAPRTRQGCQECMATGGTWKSLMMCLACGYVGCGDDSRYRHALVHSEQTGHAVAKPFDASAGSGGPGRRYCFVDELWG